MSPSQSSTRPAAHLLSPTSSQTQIKPCLALRPRSAVAPKTPIGPGTDGVHWNTRRALEDMHIKYETERALREKLQQAQRNEQRREARSEDMQAQLTSRCADLEAVATDLQEEVEDARAALQIAYRERDAHAQQLVAAKHEAAVLGEHAFHADVELRHLRESAMALSLHAEQRVHDADARAQASQEHADAAWRTAARTCLEADAALQAALAAHSHARATALAAQRDIEEARLHAAQSVQQVLVTAQEREAAAHHDAEAAMAVAHDARTQEALARRDAEEAGRQVIKAKEDATCARREAELAKEELRQASIHYEQTITYLNSQSHLMIASIYHAHQEIEQRTTKDLSEARTEIHNEHLRANAAEGDARMAEATIVELREALQEAEQFLDHARAMAASQGLAAEELQCQLDDALRSANKLRARTSDFQKQNEALRKRVERFPSQRQRAIEKAVDTATEAATHENVFHLKEKGIVPESVRELLRDLITLGVKVCHVNDVIKLVGEAAGLTVKGSVSSRTAGRTIGEAWLAHMMQTVEVVGSADGMLCTSLSYHLCVD